VVVISRLMVVVMLVIVGQAGAETLPEDRIQVMYHSYDGGGVTVDGPAVLVRKELKDQYSVNVGYYRDSISGASPDVIATASPYTENRDVFSQMSTLSLGYSVGNDTVERVDNDFSEDLKRYQFSVGLTQVLTSTMLMNLSVEGITDEGFLSNPYRSVRIFGSFAGPEVYPDTRTSAAYAIRVKKLLWGDDVVTLGYRFYDDSWSITAHTGEVGFTRTMSDRLVLDLDYRFYDQSSASFFSSDFQGLFRFMASDKELSSYQSHTVGLGLTYELFNNYFYGFDRGELGLTYDFRINEYDNYFAPNASTSELYEFDANVFNINLSLFY